MFRKETCYLGLFSAIFLSASLVACGSSDSGNGFTGTDTTTTNTILTTTEKQTIAELTVSAIDIFDFVDAVLGVSRDIGTLTSSSLACASGSGTQTVVNNPPLNLFDSGDSVSISANNCIDSDGDTINGSVTVTGTTTGAAAIFANFSIDASSKLSGNVQVNQSANFDTGSGTGSINITIPEFTATADNTTITLRNGAYIFALSGNNYTYNVDHEVASNLFTGSIKITTGASGLTGTTNSDDAFGFSVSNPIAGNLNIAFPDGSTGSVSANNGDPAAYLLTIDNQNSTVSW